LPAHNHEAEQYLLGCILLESDLIKEISLQPEHFHHAGHRVIFESMRSVEKKSEPIDVVTVTTHIGVDKMGLVGGVPYLASLPNFVLITETYKTHEKYILDAWKLRQAEMIANRLRSEIEDAADATPISRTISDLSRLEEMGYDEDSDIYSTTMEVFEEMEQDTGDLSGIDTGFYDLNAFLNGLQKQDLIIVAARPSMGKTAFALNIGLTGAKNGVQTSIFSLEMSKKSLVRRMICTEGRIDATKMRNPRKLFHDEDWPKATMAVSMISSLPLHIYDKPAVTTQEIRAKARKLKRQHPDDKHLLIVDYLQLIRGSGNENRVQEVAEMSRELKLIARELDMPVVVLSQLSRNVEQRRDKRPILSDLRESGSIEQDADVILFLYRDDYYNPESPVKNITEVLIAKQRNGATGKVELSFIKQFQKFQSLAR
jgi:replicative DNA helicase